MNPRMISITGVQEWREGAIRTCSDYLAGEEPLEICIGERPLTVTMRTPGHDAELALGFLLTEGVIHRRAEVSSITRGSGANAGNRVHVELAPGAAFDARTIQRNFYTASSCGVCGKASIDALRLRNLKPPSPDLVVDSELLCSLPDRLRAAQPLFGRTGGLHAAALFTSTGELLALREDIGRHNAVDKVIGWALSHDRLPLGSCLLMVSGRGGFEIVQKALAAGVPLLASVSAPSDLAVKLAREFGMSLIGFLRGRRFVIYSGASRLATNELRLAG